MKYSKIFLLCGLLISGVCLAAAPAFIRVEYENSNPPDDITKVGFEAVTLVKKPSNDKNSICGIYEAEPSKNVYANEMQRGAGNVIFKLSGDKIERGHIAAVFDEKGTLECCKIQVGLRAAIECGAGQRQAIHNGYHPSFEP